MDVNRHKCYKLGNTQEESLENCKLYDACDSDIEKIFLIASLYEKCTSERDKEYVKSL